MAEDSVAPRVSVVMPVYNHESFLWSACHSVLEQEYDNLQLIAWDDGSTDSSASLLEQISKDWPAARFRWMSTANRGAHAALNSGIDLADGDVVMFINSDDYYAAGRVRSAVRALSGTVDLRSSWGFSAVSFIDAAGDVADPADHGFPVYRDYMYHVAMGAWAAEILPWHNIALTSGNLIIGRDLLARVGAFANLRLAHDWDMALRLLAVVDPVVIPDALYLYRFHGTNTFRGLDAAVADSESTHVHKNWAEAVSAAPMGSSASLPFVARLRRRRGLHAAWDGA
jgi:glycosyltransferase involved in cell wall biosynthesis